MNKDAIFFVGQKAFIKKGNEVLVLNNPQGKIDYPGGKMQEGETDIAESLKREVKEETGLEINVGNAFTTWINILPSHHKNAGQKIFLVGYQCEYVSGEVKLSNEHDKFTWASKDTYKMFDSTDDYYKALDKYFNL